MGQAECLKHWHSNNRACLLRDPTDRARILIYIRRASAALFAVAHALGIPDNKARVFMHALERVCSTKFVPWRRSVQVTIKTRRLGGGFGGKAAHATKVATAAAVAAAVAKTQVGEASDGI